MFGPVPCSTAPESIRRWVSEKLDDVRFVEDFGAKGDGVTDDTTALQAAIDSGPVHFRARKYRFTAQLVVPGDNKWLRGAGDFAGGTWLYYDGAATGIDLIDVRGASHARLSDLYISSNTPLTGGSAIRLGHNGANSSYAPMVENVRIDNCSNGVLCEGVTIACLRHLQLRNLSGLRGVHITGTQAFKSSRVVIDDMVADNPLQVPGTTTWIDFDSYGYSLVVNKAALINGKHALAMNDTANTGSSYPIWAYVWDLEADHSYGNCVNLAGGEGFFMMGSWIGSSRGNNGVKLGASFRGESQIIGCRIYGNWFYGILFDAGPVHTIIANNFIGDNNVSNSAAVSGIGLVTGCAGITITGNKVGDCIGVAGNNQKYGVLINGACTDLDISHNDLTGNVDGALFLAAAGTRCRIEDNRGHNPIGGAALALSASPFTYTAGPSPETIYIRGGMVGDVKHGTRTVLTATNCTLHLGPNEAMTITYSSAPVLEKYVH